MRDGISVVMQQANTCPILFTVTFRNFANNSPALISEKSIPMDWAIARSDLCTRRLELQAQMIWAKWKVKCDKLSDPSFHIITPGKRMAPAKYYFSHLSTVSRTLTYKDTRPVQNNLSQRANGCHNITLCYLTKMMTSIFAELSGLYLHVSNQLWKCQRG